MATLAMKLSKKNRVRHGSDWTSHIFFVIVAFVLGVFSLLVFALLLWALITAIKNPDDYIFDKNYLGFPNFVKYGVESLWSNFVRVLSKFTFEVDESYYTVFAPDGMYSRTVTVSFIDMVFNSLIYSVCGSLLMVFVPATVAYVLAKYNFKFSKFVYSIALITYIIPIVGNYPAMMSVLRTLGLLDQWVGFFVMKFNFLGMYFFIFYSFFSTMSNSYIEAAELDGANQFQIMTRVAFPLAKNIIISVLLVVFIQTWNDFQTPYLYLHTHPTIAYGVWYMSFYSVNGASDICARMASVMTMALPILLLFIFLKERLMTNMTLGGIKD